TFEDSGFNFFFFQAEDGIRDRNVTGVQTCALPIYSKDKKWAMDIQHKAIKQYKSLIDWEQTKFEAYCIMNPESKAFQKTDSKMRSEERRVGKECRYRRSR